MANKDIELNIPLTASAIMDEDLFSWLIEKIEDTDIKSGALSFSIAANDATDYENNAVQLMKKLKESGHKVCIANASNDYIDFIKKVMPDTLKLAEYLTTKMTGEEAEPDLIKNMIEFAKENNSACIASGVNGASDLAQLWQTGVNFVQGNYLQTPQEKMDYDFSDIA